MPGHGPLLEPWPAALDDERRYFLKLSARRQSLTCARPRSPARGGQSAGGEERDKWRLFDVYNARNATAAYAEYEWDP